MAAFGPPLGHPAAPSKRRPNSVQPLGSTSKCLFLHLAVKDAVIDGSDSTKLRQSFAVGSFAFAGPLVISRDNAPCSRVTGPVRPKVRSDVWAQAAQVRDADDSRGK